MLLLKETEWVENENTKNRKWKDNAATINKLTEYQNRQIKSSDSNTR